MAAKEWLLLGAGIPIGLVANLLYQYLRFARERWVGRVALAGCWGERMAIPGERQYSAGEIRFDARRRMWTFDGTNYNNDGTPYCEWYTHASYLNLRENTLYYVFVNTPSDESQTGYTGFGAVLLGRVGGRLKPKRGYFVAGEPGGEYRTHSMVPIGRLPDSAAEARRLFDSELGGAVDG